MIKNTVCHSSMPITGQAGLRAHKIVGCAMRTRADHQSECPRCARRTLRPGEKGGLGPAPAAVILVRNTG